MSERGYVRATPKKKHTKAYTSARANGRTKKVNHPAQTCNKIFTHFRISRCVFPRCPSPGQRLVLHKFDEAKLVMTQKIVSKGFLEKNKFVLQVDEQN